MFRRTTLILALLSLAACGSAPAVAQPTAMPRKAVLGDTLAQFATSYQLDSQGTGYVNYAVANAIIGISTDQAPQNVVDGRVMGIELSISIHYAANFPDGATDQIARTLIPPDSQLVASQDESDGMFGVSSDRQYTSATLASELPASTFATIPGSFIVACNIAPSETGNGDCVIGTMLIY